MKRKAWRSAFWMMLLSVAVASAETAPYRVGEKVNDFTLKDTDGKTVKLSQFKGKVIVLAFSAAFWGTCNAEAPRLEKEVWQKHKARGVQVIGINGGDPDRKAKAFKTRHGLTFPYLLDREQAVIDRFSETGALPHLAIIGKDLTLKYSEAGATVEDLVSKLNELLAAKWSVAFHDDFSRTVKNHTVLVYGH